MGQVLSALLALTACLPSLAQDGDFAWAAGMGSGGAEEGQSVAVDTAGNVYVTGSFGGTVDFAPGLGTFNLTSVGGTDVFVLKLDSAGNFVWARAFSGVTDVTAGGIAVDGNGNVYTMGRFAGTVDFDPGFGSFALTPASSAAVFVTKLNPAGNFVWARAIGDATEALARGIALDGSGNVYSAGFFDGTADFDPGAGTFNLTSPAGGGVFVSKLDNAGDFVWARATGGNDFSEAAPFGIASDGVHIHVTGIFGGFGGTVDFDPGVGTFNLNAIGNFDAFVLKLDAAGNFVWVRSAGTAGESLQSRGIAVDGAGSVYTAGLFRGTVDFDPGGGTFTLSATGSTADIHVWKLDAGGNFGWARAMGGASTDQALGIALDAGPFVYTTGLFAGTTDFDPGPGLFELTDLSGDVAIFVSKLDSAGDFVWARSMTGAGGAFGNSIAVDGGSNVYTTGAFSDIVDFDPGAGIQYLVAVGFNDIFVSKLSGLDRRITSNLNPSTIQSGYYLVLTAPPGTSYQWKKDGVNVVDDPPRLIGSNNSQLIFDPVLESDAGIYTVVYDDGSNSTAASFPFTLNVLPAGSLPAAGLKGLAALAVALSCGAFHFVRVGSKNSADRKTQ